MPKSAKRFSDQHHAPACGRRSRFMNLEQGDPNSS
jgi:hypothetical protein